MKLVDKLMKYLHLHAVKVAKDNIVISLPIKHGTHTRATALLLVNTSSRKIDIEINENATGVIQRDHDFRTHLMSNILFYVKLLCFVLRQETEENYEYDSGIALDSDSVGSLNDFEMQTIYIDRNEDLYVLCKKTRSETYGEYLWVKRLSDGIYERFRSGTGILFSLKAVEMHQLMKKRYETNIG